MESYTEYIDDSDVPDIDSIELPKLFNFMD